MDKYQDPEFFNYQYQKYIEHLQKQNDEEPSYNDPSLSKQSSNATSEDREENSYLNQQDSGISAVSGSTQHTSNFGGVSNEEMINITSCDESEFQSYMCR